MAAAGFVCDSPRPREVSFAIAISYLVSQNVVTTAAQQYGRRFIEEKCCALVLLKD